MILEVDGSYYETYQREKCAGCSFHADFCALQYKELECVDEFGKKIIWKPISRETVQAIIRSRIK